MAKDRKKKRKDKKRRDKRLQPYRPSSGLSKEQMLMALISRTGAGPSGGHISVSMPSYHGGGPSGAPLSGVMDELSRLGGLVNTLVADSKRGAPPPETSMPSLASFGIQTEPVSAAPATTSTSMETGDDPEPVAVNTTPFVFGDSSNFMGSPVFSRQNNRRSGVVRASRPSRSTGGFHFNFDVPTHQNQLVVASGGGQVEVPNPAGGSAPIVDATSHEGALVMWQNQTEDMDVEETPVLSEASREEVAAPPLQAAPSGSIHREPSVFVETVDDEEDSAPIPPTAPETSFTGTPLLPPTETTSEPPPPPAAVPATEPIPPRPPGGDSSPDVETPTAPSDPEPTPPAASDDAPLDPHMTPEEINRQTSTIEEEIRSLEKQKAEAESRAEKAKRAYYEYQKKIDKFDKARRKIHEDVKLDGPARRAAVTELRRKYFGSGEKVGDQLKAEMDAADGDVVVLNYDLEQLRNKKAEQQRAEAAAKSVNDTIDRLRKRLDELAKFRQIGNGPAESSAPSNKRPREPNVFVETVEEETAPKRTSGPPEPEVETVNGMRLLPPHEPPPAATAASMTPEANSSSNALVVPIERPVHVKRKHPTPAKLVTAVTEGRKKRSGTTDSTAGSKRVAYQYEVDEEDFVIEEGEAALLPANFVTPNPRARYTLAPSARSVMERSYSHALYSGMNLPAMVTPDPRAGALVLSEDGKKKTNSIQYID